MTEATPSIERVFIEADEFNPRAEQVRDQLATHLGAVAIEVADDISEADALMILGGDGTFSNMLHKHSLPNLPVAGVNIGNVGFLMDTSPDDNQFADRAKRLALGEFRIQPVPTVQMEEASTGLVTNAVNEVVIERASAQALHAKYRLGRATFASYTGDGLIIANALGSTGYAASAGGEYMDPDIQAYQLVHSNEYRSNRTDSIQKPPIIGPHTKVIVEMTDIDKRPYRLTRDGYDLSDWACDGSPLTVGLAIDRPINIIRFDDYDWATHLRDVLHPRV